MSCRKINVFKVWQTCKLADSASPIIISQVEELYFMSQRVSRHMSARRQQHQRAKAWWMVLAPLLLTFIHIGPAIGKVPRMAGWTQQFADDFNGPAGQLPASGVWRIDTGAGWGTGEIETYTRNPANVSLDGHGHLRITPLRQSRHHWTSARIETKRANFKPPPHGVLRIQARIQLPDVTGKAALGYWPAFWALGGRFRQSGDWPQIGEFDVMENVNGVNAVWGTLHCGFAPGGPCNEPKGLGKRTPCPKVRCQAGFHTYTFDWDRSKKPQQLRWYVDGRLYHRVTQNQLPQSTWKQITGHGGYFLLLDVAMGGDFPFKVSGGRSTPVAATQSGHPMVVDYVAVWTRRTLDGAGDRRASKVRQP